ncbi:alginate export family protein [Pseudomonas aeruginosa]|nr:alginate export family protein [Pseudomonas aeruginosa]
MDWSWDLAGQFGRLAGAGIRAWALSSDSGYTFATAWKPRLGLRLDAASGDRAARRRTGTDLRSAVPAQWRLRRGGADHALQRDHRRAGAGLLALAAVAHRARAVQGLEARAGDAVYYPGMGVAASAQQSRGRDVGNILRANLKWFASKNLTFDLDYKYYDVGGALRSAGADNSQFVSLRGTYRF